MNHMLDVSQTMVSRVLTLLMTYQKKNWLSKFKKHHLCKRNVADYSSVCISTKGRLQNACEFAVSVWYMAPASDI